jgi:hypothetical protein
LSCCSLKVDPRSWKCFSSSALLTSRSSWHRWGRNQLRWRLLSRHHFPRFK